MQGQVKREIPEKTRPLAASSGTIVTCENPGATPPGIEPVNITSILTGVGIGWSSPVLPLLQSDGNPVGDSPMSDEVASWLGSVVALGALLSTPVYGPLSKHCSRKIVGYVVAAFGLLGWSLIVAAPSEVVLLAGRFLIGVRGRESKVKVQLIMGTGFQDQGQVMSTKMVVAYQDGDRLPIWKTGYGRGFVASGNNILCSIYVAETVDDDIRGSLGALISMFISGGIVFCYVLGSYLPYTTFNIICLTIPGVFLVAYWWMPESPVYLESKGQYIEAQKVRELLNMKYINTNTADVTLEDKNKKHEEDSFFSEVMHNRGTRIGLIIGIGAMVCNQFSGVMAVVSYTVSIFQESGSDLSPNVATILVGTLQVVGVYVASLLVDRLGRKVLFIISSFIAATCLGSLSLYFYLRNREFDVSYFGWVPVTSLCAYMVGFAIGVGSIPFIVIGEIFAPHVKSIAIALCVCTNNLSSFLVSRFFMSLCKALGLSSRESIWWSLASLWRSRDDPQLASTLDVTRHSRDEGGAGTSGAGHRALGLLHTATSLPLNSSCRPVIKASVAPAMAPRMGSSSSPPGRVHNGKLARCFFEDSALLIVTRGTH
ncbi:hypothetical protein PR048_022948 [Dryococelus australis]|uniref:Major facilitator superfamily (MFS) profile domain-containing protein n=1 Tax=Dryococelus australis TaxID=614101 RepID=A0ABQ9GSS8_9NEOP|nr:hypothetical protein PR048_022948 [Dryococelus australis]